MAETETVPGAALRTRHDAAVQVLTGWQRAANLGPEQAAAVAYALEALEAEEAQLAPPVLPPADSLRGAYLAAALAQAEVTWDAAGQRFFGAIPACPGVWAAEPTVAACRAELASALNDWLSAGLAAGQPVPVFAGIDLNPRRAAE